MGLLLLFTLLGEGDHGALLAPRRGREVCGHGELLKILPTDALPSHKSSLALSNSRVSGMSLSDGLVFMVL